MAICGGVRLMLGGFCRISRMPAGALGCLAIVRFSAAHRDFGGVGVGCACLPCIHLEVALFKLCPLSTCVAPWRAWGCGVCLRVVWGLFLPFCGLFLGWGVCVPACLLCLHPEHLKCARYRQCWALIWGGCFLPMLPFLIVPAGASGFDFL